MINPDVKRNTPKVSVIVPVYNVEKYVEKCLDSLYQQTLRPEEFEVIVVDDKSTDNSLKIVKEFKRKSKRENIKIIENKKNLGPGKTRNIALKEAKGEYIYFLDSDDYIDPITLEVLLMFAYDNDSDMVIAGFNKVDEDGNIEFSGGLPKKILENKFSLIAGLCTHNVISMDCNRLIKRSLFVDNNIYFLGGVHEDVLPMLKLYFYANNVAVYKDYLYYWLTRKGSITRTISTEHIDAFLDALILREEFLAENTSAGFMRKLERPLSIGLHNVSNTLITRVIKNPSISESDKERLLKHLYFKIKENPHSSDLLAGNFEDTKLIDTFFESLESEETLDRDIQEFLKNFSIGSSTSKIELIKQQKILSINSKLKKLRKYANRVIDYQGNFFQKIGYLWNKGLDYLCRRRLRKKKNYEVKMSNTKYIKSEILFFCEANYHIRNAAPVVRKLKKEYERVSIIDMTGFLAGGKRKLNKKELKEYRDIDVISYDRNTYNNIDLNVLKVAIFFNDWGINNSFIRKLRHKGILTIGIDEGVNDFLKLGEGFTSKISPYRTVEHVFLPGEFEIQFFKDRPGQHHIVGLPMIRKLYKEEVNFPKKPLAVINVNFTYGVLTWYRDLFVKTAVEGCKLAGIDYVLTQHPMDNADLSEYNVTDKNMYDTIRGGSIFISRFSGAIIEALAMGKPCVYHNPHNEKILKFQEPMGAYSISDSAESLAKAIKYELDRSSKTSVREYSRKFMEYHANIHSRKEPAELITETIIKLIKS
jgi:glycosyltransferase involved in cell wall biosynthesis